MSDGDDRPPDRRGGPWWPPASRPRAVEGGLKARSTRGAIAQTWWSGRFIAVLESIIVGGRLQRGRNYARRGQVLSMDVTAGLVSALVQGSRVQPYRIRIGLDAFGRPEWAAAERALAGSAWYSAKLLAGEMPEDIEDVFAELGLALFPASAAELSMYCSCPDWQVPCKHIAAVFYLLAEAFDDDPFRILAWRGREREELLAGLHAARGALTPAQAAPAGAPATGRGAGDRGGGAGRLPRLVLRAARAAPGDQPAGRVERLDPRSAPGAAPRCARPAAAGAAAPRVRGLPGATRNRRS